MTIHTGDTLKVMVEVQSGEFEKKIATVKKIVDKGDYVMVHLEYDGYIPLVVGRGELRKMMEKAKPGMFDEEIDDTII